MTEKNIPNEILKVELVKCFIFNIIKEEKTVIRTKKKGNVVNFNN